MAGRSPVCSPVLARPCLSLPGSTCGETTDAPWLRHLSLPALGSFPRGDLPRKGAPVGDGGHRWRSSKGCSSGSRSTLQRARGVRPRLGSRIPLGRRKKSETAPMCRQPGALCIGRCFVISGRLWAKLSKGLYGLPHPDRDHKCCCDRDKIENAENGLEALTHNIGQWKKDHQQYEHGDRPNT